MSRIRIILLITFVLAISFLVVGIHQISQQEKPKPVVHTTPHELSSKEYQQTRDELVKILEKKDPRAALAELREKSTSDEAIAGSCHGLVHEIGHEAYKKYGDFGKAMQYQDELCNSGYLHGIIETHFAQAKDLTATMKTVCNNYNPTTFIGWECFHGIGHGLMYFTENDLPKSLSLCDSYNNVDEQYACINGVFMENFNVDQKLHKSKFVKAEDPFYPCNEQPKEKKHDCYLYAPIYFLNLHKSEYSKALTWCKTAEKDFVSICTIGVGTEIMKRNINNPKFVESICMQQGTSDTKLCIRGMVSLYISHFGGLTEAKNLCRKLEKSNQETCQQTIASLASLFN